MRLMFIEHKINVYFEYWWGFEFLRVSFFMHNLNQQKKKSVMVVVMKSHEEQLNDQNMNMKLWKIERRNLAEKFERLMSQNVQHLYILG